MFGKKAEINFIYGELEKLEEKYVKLSDENFELKKEIKHLEKKYDVKFIVYTTQTDLYEKEKAVTIEKQVMGLSKEHVEEKIKKEYNKFETIYYRNFWTKQVEILKIKESK